MTSFPSALTSHSPTLVSKGRETNGAPLIPDVHVEDGELASVNQPVNFCSATFFVKVVLNPGDLQVYVYSAYKRRPAINMEGETPVA
jgi:hypothetical protein